MEIFEAFSDVFFRLMFSDIRELCFPLRLLCFEKCFLVDPLLLAEVVGVCVE